MGGKGGFSLKGRNMDYIQEGGIKTITKDFASDIN
jgi:hypothetical protein